MKKTQRFDIFRLRNGKRAVCIGRNLTDAQCRKAAIKDYSYPRDHGVLVQWITKPSKG
jgi:hypothetical protein